MPNILDEVGQLSVIEQITKQLTDDQGKALKVNKTQLGKIQNNINAAKGQLIEAKTYRDQASGEVEELTAKVYDVYDNFIHSKNTIDFHDMIIGMIRLWTEQPEVLKAYQEYYQEGYIFGDEAQDLGPLQVEWLKMLAGGEKARLTVVGDVRQSIMSFRNESDQSPVDSIRDWHPAMQEIQLTENYRSPTSIISLAQKIIEGDPTIPQIDMKSIKGESGILPKYYVGENVGDEIEFVVNQADQLVNEQGYDLSDIAVFARTHAEIEKFAQAFKKKRIRG